MSDIIWKAGIPDKSGTYIVATRYNSISFMRYDKNDKMWVNLKTGDKVECIHIFAYCTESDMYKQAKEAVW